MVTNTEKKTYIRPMIMEHHPIYFETMISGNDSSLIPFPPKEEPDSPARHHQPEPHEGNSPSSQRYPLSKLNTDHTSMAQPTDQNPSDAIPVEHHSPLGEKGYPLFISGYRDFAILGPGDPPFLPDQDQTTTGESSSSTTSERSGQTTSSEMTVTTFSMDHSKEHTDLWPNKDSTWYNWGLEGLILASLSGLTLWAIKRRTQKE